MFYKGEDAIDRCHLIKIQRHIDGEKMSLMVGIIHSFIVITLKQNALASSRPVQHVQRSQTIK